MIKSSQGQTKECVFCGVLTYQTRLEAVCKDCDALLRWNHFRVPINQAIFIAKELMKQYESKPPDFFLYQRVQHAVEYVEKLTKETNPRIFGVYHHAEPSKRN